MHINDCRVSCGGVFNMLLVLSISFYFHYNIWGCICSTGPFQYWWLKGFIYSSCFYHHQIGSIHLSHCYHIFPWLCAWDVCYIIFCHLLHKRSGKTGNLFSFLLCSLWWVQIVGHLLPCRSYSFVFTVHHLIIIIVQIIWRHWTYKMPVRYILSSVWVGFSIFSQFSIIQSIIIQYVGLCVFSLPTPLVMIERIYILCLIIIIKSDVWTIIHCLGLGHETMVCAVCLSIFLWYSLPLKFLSGVPDLWDRNKILSGGDLSHYQVPHCIRVFFYFVWFVFIHHTFQFYFELCTYCNILDIYLS